MPKTKKVEKVETGVGVDLKFVFDEDTFELIGAKPLLCSRPPEQIDDGRGNTGKEKRKSTQEEIFEASKYYYSNGSNGDPKYGFPASGIIGAMTNAIRHMQGNSILGNKKTALSMKAFASDAGAIVEVVDGQYSPDYGIDLIPIYSDSEPILHKRQARNKNTGALVTAVSACFENWSTKFTLRYMPSRITRAQVSALLTVAGLCGGLGTYRKMYGRYKIASSGVVK